MSILDLFRLDGRVAVVTGSGRGIGRAIALADAGADVVVTARRAHEVAAVAGEARGRRAVEVAADLRGDTPERLAAAAVDELGRLDVWVDNAGGTDDPSVRPLARTSDEQLREMLELNLVSVLACVRAAAARLHRGGAIVTVASGAGMRGARDRRPRRGEGGRPQPDRHPRRGAGAPGGSGSTRCRRAWCPPKPSSRRCG